MSGFFAPAETGAWTPALNFVTPGDFAATYTLQTGTYVRIGKVVVYNYRIITSAFTHTTASGFVYISGLPFGTSGLFQPSGSVAVGGYTKAGYVPTDHESGDPGQTRFYIRLGGSGNSMIEMTAADMPTGGAVIVYGSGTYVTT